MSFEGKDAAQKILDQMNILIEHDKKVLELMQRAALFAYQKRSQKNISGLLDEIDSELFDLIDKIDSELFDLIDEVLPAIKSQLDHYNQNEIELEEEEKSFDVA